MSVAEEMRKSLCCFIYVFFVNTKIETAQNLVLRVCQDFQTIMRSGCKRLVVAVKNKVSELEIIFVVIGD